MTRACQERLQSYRQSVILCPHSLISNLTLRLLPQSLSLPSSPQKTPYNCEAMSMQKIFGVCFLSGCSVLRVQEEEERERKGARWVWRREKHGPSEADESQGGRLFPLEEVTTWFGSFSFIFQRLRLPY